MPLNKQLIPASQTKMKTLWILGDFYTVKVSGDETGGRYSVWEVEVAPNNGPPLHRHSREDESFYVLEGEFSFPYGDKEAKAGKGQFMYVPKGEFHTYKNISDSSFGKLLLIVSPPQFEKFFEEIGIPMDAEKSSFQPPAITPTVIENVVKTSAKYGIEIKL
jgi:quercetin dioxygenase-like cupin family protein